MPDKSLIWFRKNLRVFDNKCLSKALTESQEVIAIYVIDERLFEMTPYGFKRASEFRLKFLYESLINLKNNLAMMNLELIILEGNSFQQISKIINSLKITDVYYEKDIAFEERLLEKQLKRNFRDIKFHKHNANYIFDYEEVKSKVRKLPDTFTKFRKDYEELYLSAEKKLFPVQYEYTAKQINFKQELTAFQKSQTSSESNLKIVNDLTERIDKFSIQADPRATFVYQGGENVGLDRIKQYIWEQKSIKRYKKTRNELMGRNFSSRFSAWLSLGCISMNHVLYEIEKFEKQELENDSTYWLKFELLWREYFRLLYGKYKIDIFKLKGPHDRDTHSGLDTELCNKWMTGKTGEAFIDANMISLNYTGYMSNRGRQNVVSYLIHDLKQDWRFAASYFEHMLIDHDVFSNWLNCSYIAGLVATEKPHIFNIQKQAETYDPKRKFQKHWL